MVSLGRCIFLTRIASLGVAHWRSFASMSCHSPGISLVLACEGLWHSSCIWDWSLRSGHDSTDFEVWMGEFSISVHVNFMSIYLFGVIEWRSFSTAFRNLFYRTTLVGPSLGRSMFLSRLYFGLYMFAILVHMNELWMNIWVFCLLSFNLNYNSVFI